MQTASTRAPGAQPRRRGALLGTLLTSAIVAALAILTGWIVHTLGYIDADTQPTFLLAIAGCWGLFALAAVLLRFVPARAVTAIVLAGTAAIGGAAMLGPPDTSTDSARYAWDGIVQHHGVSPYEYVPADVHLAALRPEWLFPAPASENAATGAATCTGARIAPSRQIGSSTPICTAINRPTVPTIYPPAAEIVYLAVRALVPSSAEYWPMQAFGLLVALGTTLLLLRALRRYGRDPRWAALWGWSPLVAFEGVTNSHIDLLGAALALAGTLVAIGSRPIRGGVLLGLAIATKVLPVLVLPALVRRHPVRLLGAAVLTVALLYVPYVAASGFGVLGYLPGYLNEEGYDSGARSALLSAVLPSAATTPVAAALLLIIAIVILLRCDPAHPWFGQLVLIGAALFLASPRYGWYSLLLVPFIAMSGRWEWFGVALALSAQQLAPDLVRFRWELLAALALILIGSLFRARSGHGAHRQERLRT